MLDRTKIKKHYVWDEDKRPANPGERYLLWVTENGGCGVVNGVDEQRFINDKDFGVSFYNHYGEDVPQLKKRFMTNDEMLKFCVVNINKIIVSHNEGKFYHIGYYTLDGAACRYRYMYIDQLDKPVEEREVHLFEEM